MTPVVQIRSARSADVPAFADLLIACVEGGASVSFMLPLSRERAEKFWRGVLEAAARGERIVLVAEDTASQAIVGTVQLVLTMPDNQPHRADAERLYSSLGWQRCGIIPGYALWPDGRPVDTVLFYKLLARSASS